MYLYRYKIKRKNKGNGKACMQGRKKGRLMYFLCNHELYCIIVLLGGQYFSYVVVFEMISLYVYDIIFLHC